MTGNKLSIKLSKLKKVPWEIKDVKKDKAGITTLEKRTSMELINNFENCYF